MVSRFLVLSALFSLALAKPHARNLKVHEFLEQAPSGFVKTGAADADTQIKLRIALVQNNPNGLIDALYAVSSPDSATYGEHLSKEEVRLACARSYQFHANRGYIKRSKNSSLLPRSLSMP